jgi:alpha-ketoglutarate-dependent taurine dioxygenase
VGMGEGKDPTRTGAATTGGGPFSLDDPEAYRRWRDAKLAAFPRRIEDLKVAVADLARPTAAERAGILHAVGRANMAIYVSGHTDLGAHLAETRSALRTFLASFGLESVEHHRSAESDGFVAIEVSEAPAKRGFIPYTTRPLNWHTDGSYNPPDASIRSMLLHCVRAADAGGANALLDPEIAYIRLRDAEPRWLAALMHPEAMTIPPSIEEDGGERPVSIGPVFRVDPTDGSLQMRYTARSRNVVWRDSADTRDAVGFMQRLLKEEPLILTTRLAPGEGLICNNVLHTRTAFDSTGSEHRLVLRARFASRIAGVGGRPSHAAVV